MKGALWLLQRFLPADDRDAILGDLVEEQMLRRRAGEPNASVWFWRQVLRSVAPIVWLVFCRGSWIATLAAGGAAYGIVKIEESTAALVWPVLPAALSGSPWFVGLLGLCTMLLGGMFASWMRRGADVALAAISTCMVVHWMLNAGASMPFLWQLYFLLSCPAAALAGAKLIRIRSA
ncbi:MAG: hypothetical protein AB1762_03870 [Gemmatimonadota bacterium]